MALQKPEQSHLRRESQKQLQRRLYIAVAVLTLSFFALSASMGVVATLRIIHSNWPVVLGILLAAFGIVCAFIQWLFPYILEENQTIQISSDSQLTITPTPSNTIRTSEQPALEHQSFSQKSAYHHIVGLPPPTFSGTIQQRKRIVEEIYGILIQPTITAIVLTGMGGVGKSTLAALIYRYAEDQRSNGAGPFKDEAIWLTINDNATMVDLAGTLFEALGEPLPDLSTLSSYQLAVAVFKALDTVDKARLVILDQFENMLDKQSGYVGGETERPGVGEWLDALNSQPCRCRVLLTSRILPQGTREYPPSHMQEYCVKGLDIAEGVELLRKQGVEPTQATDAELSYAVLLAQGHALALILLASLLRRNRSLTLSTFFQDHAYLQLWNGDIARNLLHYIYQEQLDAAQRDLLLAFSIYREPVQLDAAEMLIEGISRPEIVGALNGLIAQHLMQAAGEGHYKLHPIVAQYALSQFQMKDEGKRNKNLLDVRTAHTRAVEYYLEQAKKCPPRELRRSSNDIRPFIEAIWHQCHAGKWREAYNLMEQEYIFPDLKRWGGNAILLELYQLLLPLVDQSPESQEAVALYIYLGRVYRTLGRREKAKEYFEKALAICEKQHYYKDEGTVYSFLGSVYADLGMKAEAQRHLERAIQIRTEVGDREGESWTLANLGRIYHDLGQEQLALQTCEWALEVTRDAKNRRGEERTLNTLGHIYNNFGEKERALKHYEEALKICREVGDRLGEGLTLNGLGLVYLGLGDKQKALRLLRDSLMIRQEVMDRGGEGRTLSNLANLYRLLGRNEEAYTHIQQSLMICREIGDREGEAKSLNILSMLVSDQEALAYLREALDICKEVGDRRGEGWTLHNLGGIYSNQGRKQEAQSYYAQALQLRREVGDRRGQAWTLHNMGILYFEQQKYAVALACLLHARSLFEEVHSPDRKVAQQNIERLSEKVGEEQFSKLLAYIESQPDSFLDQALREALYAGETV